MPSEEGKTQEPGWRPIPDPTVLTTEALRREISVLQEKIELRVTGLFQTLSARLDAMDKAQILFDANLNRLPSDTDKQIAHLKSLHEAKFLSVEKQFAERDTRTDQASRDGKVALDAALQAARDAVAEQNRSSALAIAKSDAATDKRIDQIASQISTATNALDGKIADIKDRLVRIEGQALGQDVAKVDKNTSSSFSVSVIGIGLAVVSALIAIAALFSRFLLPGK
jgi:hypothetical protein